MNQSVVFIRNFHESIASSVEIFGLTTMQLPILKIGLVGLVDTKAD